jgi:hypothetical protein
MTVSLAELRILTLDCQATGANPQKGHLLELGWMAAGASLKDKSQAPCVQAYLNRLPADQNCPGRFHALPGYPVNLWRPPNHQGSSGSI